MRQGKLKKICGDVVQVTAIGGRHGMIFAFVYQYELRVGGVFRKPAFEQVLADHAQASRAGKTERRRPWSPVSQRGPK